MFLGLPGLESGVTRKEPPPNAELYCCGFSYVTLVLLLQVLSSASSLEGVIVISRKSGSHDMGRGSPGNISSGLGKLPIKASKDALVPSIEPFLTVSSIHTSPHCP